VEYGQCASASSLHSGLGSGPGEQSMAAGQFGSCAQPQPQSFVKYVVSAGHAKSIVSQLPVEAYLRPVSVAGSQWSSRHVMVAPHAVRV